MNRDEAVVALAIHHLRVARLLLASAPAPKALARVRAALKSAEGAQRHARLAPYRLERRQRRDA